MHVEHSIRMAGFDSAIPRFESWRPSHPRPQGRTGRVPPLLEKAPVHKSSKMERVPQSARQRLTWRARRKLGATRHDPAVGDHLAWRRTGIVKRLAVPESLEVLGVKAAHEVERPSRCSGRKASRPPHENEARTSAS